jgi:hypothetical protein
MAAWTAKKKEALSAEWTPEKRAAKSAQMKALWQAKKNAPAELPELEVPTPPEPPTMQQAPRRPSREDVAFVRGYEQGRVDGVEEAVTQMLAAFHLSLVREDESLPQGSPPATEPEKPTHAAVAPPPVPSAPPSPSCLRCGHSMEAHEPLKAGRCFEKDCDCVGFTLKKPFALKLRFGRK